MGNLSDETTINISVLQGTTLGPILFLCYINDIFNATSLATFLFADDTSCLAEHSNLNELIRFVNSELQKLANWFRSNKMAVNVEKTKYIIFRTKGKKIDCDTDPIIFNNNEIGVQNDPKNMFKLERVFTDNPIQEHRYYKLLGVYFDEYLNFDKHVSYISAKLSRANFCIKRAANKLSKKALTLLYYALVQPHLLYCNTIMNCTSGKNIVKITKLQKKAIRIVTKSKVNRIQLLYLQILKYFHLKNSLYRVNFILCILSVTIMHLNLSVMYLLVTMTVILNMNSEIMMNILYLLFELNTLKDFLFTLFLRHGIP